MTTTLGQKYIRELERACRAPKMTPMLRCDKDSVAGMLAQHGFAVTGTTAMGSPIYTRGKGPFFIPYLTSQEQKDLAELKQGESWERKDISPEYLAKLQAKADEIAKWHSEHAKSTLPESPKKEEKPKSVTKRAPKAKTASAMVYENWTCSPNEPFYSCALPPMTDEHTRKVEECYQALQKPAVVVPITDAPKYRFVALPNGHFLPVRLAA
jgi:hypothetical protein